MTLFIYQILDFVDAKGKEQLESYLKRGLNFYQLAYEKSFVQAKATYRTVDDDKKDQQLQEELLHRATLNYKIDSLFAEATDPDLHKRGAQPDCIAGNVYVVVCGYA